jgi:DNA-binding NarL/FixJ family response regulator
MLRLETAPRIGCHGGNLGPHELTDIKATPSRILIIEDHPMVLGILQASLRRLCPDVAQVCVKSATAALEVIGRPWLRVFLDPDAEGVDEGLLVHELARLGLGARCCLITTRPRQRMKRYLQGLKCLTCVGTRMPIDEFNAVLARKALGITALAGTSRDHAAPLVTPRHAELLRLLQRGLQNKAIAHELGISEGTVRNHLHSVMKRLGVRNRIQAAQEAARFGIA